MPMVERIEKVDPGAGSAWRAYFALELDADRVAGARNIEAMLRHSPTDTDLLRSMLSRIAVLGAQQEAMAISEYVVAMDPLCAQCQYQLARLYHNNGRLEESGVGSEGCTDPVA